MILRAGRPPAQILRGPRPCGAGQWRSPAGNPRRAGRKDGHRGNLVRRRDAAARKLVGMVAPAPLGCEVQYHGPYSEDGWLMINMAYPRWHPAAPPRRRRQGRNPPAARDAGDDARKRNQRRRPMRRRVPRWIPTTREKGNRSEPNSPLGFLRCGVVLEPKTWIDGLVRKTGMADRSVLRFDLAWRNRLMLCVVFHADFAKPPKRMIPPRTRSPG